MKSRTARKIKLGIFVTVMLIVFVFSLYFIGKNQNLFQPIVKVYTVFDDIKGINKGNKIRFSGLNVGAVSEIIILADTVVQVEMSIQREYIKFIKIDSRVEIDNEGLMGNKMIVIHHGSNGSASIMENSRLQARETINVEDILEEATNIVQNSRDAALNLLEVTDHIIAGKGSLGRLLYDTALVADVSFMLDNLKASSLNAKEITENINNGVGDLGKLVYSDSLTKSLNRSFKTLDTATIEIYKVAENLEKATSQINEGKGFANSLLYDTTIMTKADSTLVNLNKSIEEITKTAETIKNSWIINLFSKDKKKKENKNSTNH
jgi:phospholipid/cholesterol/gamma-HCH transport system substrate-binding protein